ncbi:DUF1642 domain-containing protein [Enterococcus faecalis]|nr:DUF1642 domain-containing protein [Enterococcus faecalis]
MNKQEKEDLIQALYDIGGCDAEDEWSRGYDDGVNAAIEVIKELKVQGKVIFSHEEKFVADWLDGLKGEISDKKLSSGAAFMVFVGQQLECLYYNEYTLITDDVEGWLLHPENKVKLLNAIDNGYEVEEEPLYYVKLPGVGYLNNSDGGIKHTEQEIKAIDENYWRFYTKKVDGE